MLNWKLLMLTHLSMKIVTHIFGYETCSIPNIFSFKIFNESIFPYWVSFEPSICASPPSWGSKAENFQNELLWVSLNSMYGLKILAGDKINHNKYDKPLDPRPPHIREPQSLNESLHLTVEACNRNLGLA